MQDRHSDTLIKEAIISLTQGRELLDQLSDEIYTRAMPPIFNYGIGSHVRHLLDFHTAFLRDLESGRIDYDTRERDISVEKNLDAALAKIDSLIERLQALEMTNDDWPLLVRLEDASADEPTWSQSTFLREMQFLQSHTVHHYALIAMMLSLQSVAVSPGFGVATSTLKQRRAA
jgi:hypothetical protein